MLSFFFKVLIDIHYYEFLFSWIFTLPLDTNVKNNILSFNIKQWQSFPLH